MIILINGIYVKDRIEKYIRLKVSFQNNNDLINYLIFYLINHYDLKNKNE